MYSIIGYPNDLSIMIISLQAVVKRILPGSVGLPKIWFTPKPQFPPLAPI